MDIKYWQLLKTGFSLPLQALSRLQKDAVVAVTPPAESMLGGHTKQELEICNRPGSCGPKKEKSFKLTCPTSPHALVTRGTQHTSTYLHKSFSRWPLKSQRICSTTKVNLAALIKTVSVAQHEQTMTLPALLFNLDPVTKQYGVCPSK